MKIYIITLCYMLMSLTIVSPHAANAATVISNNDSVVSITSLTISPSTAPQPGAPVTISVSASSNSGQSVYYKFFYCGNYGTALYNTSPWIVVQDYSTSNSAQYTFPSAGSYIVVVRAVTDPNNEPVDFSIIGQTVTVGNAGQVVISGFSSDSTPNTLVGDTVTFTANARTEASETIYYRFYYCANYGTNAYDSTPWTMVRDYTTANSCQISFPASGNYIVVVRAVTDPENEPAAVPIVGTVVKIKGTIQCATPGSLLVTDLEVHQPPSLAEPASRLPFRDPVFGSCLMRVTDRLNDKSDPGGLKNEYSRVQAFNADETRLLVRSTIGGWYLYNAQTLQPLGELPLGMDPRWSATDPAVIYFSQETVLMSYHIVTQQTSLVHEFADDFPGLNLTAVWTRYEGSPSSDGRWWGLMAEDQDYLTSALLVYDQTTDRVIATLDTTGWPAEAREIDSVTISPLGNYYLVYMDKYCQQGQLGTPAAPCGLMVYDRNLQNGRGLLRLIGHSDTALDSQGHEVLIYQDIDTDNIAMLDLATGTVTPLWPIDFTYTTVGLHFSGRAFDRPGWAVISTYDGDTASHTWMDDSVFLVELKSNGSVLRLAHTRSVVDVNQAHDYWAEPQATVNRNLSRVLFTTNWGHSGTEQVDMYQIIVPAELN